MSFLQNIFGKKQVNKRGNDGYLLPQYWQCMVCKGCNKDEQAVYAVRTMLFKMAIKDERYFQELSQTGREAVNSYFDYVSDPVGGTKEQPAGTEHLEDTAGLARDRTGMGYDAIYLCEAHMSEVRKAIQNSTKK